MSVDVLSPLSPLWPFAAPPPVVASTLATLYTTGSGPGDTAAQPVPSLSLGGFASTTPWGGGVLYDLFNRASAVDAADSRSDYRAVYVTNTDPAATAYDVRVYLTPRTAGAALTAVGVDPRPVTYVDSLAPQGVTVATAYGTPAGVTFAQPAGYAAGLSLGDLPPSTGRVVWVRRTPAASPPGAASDAVDLVFATAAAALVRRVYWETEPAADATRPAPVGGVPAFVPTPTPFRRVMVDFLTAGGARITWDLDATLTDPGPYTFQLQTSQSGGGNSDDWTDTGPPALDPPGYLLDGEQRIWGASATLHYRVVLTTTLATYVSPPANVYGLLARRDWLLVNEVVRKEVLTLRKLTGVNGFLLKARRYGTKCGCVDPVSGEVNNSSDPACYGTGYVGGYHPPVPLFFGNLSPEDADEHVGYNEGRGTVRPVTLTGRVVAGPPVVRRDVWAAVGSDERYYVTRVREAVSWKGVPVVYEITLNAAPRSDVIYALGLDRPVVPAPDWATPTVVTV